MENLVNIPKLRFSEFEGVWERINNPDFNSPEFEGIKNNNTNCFLSSMH